ncbi:hypothetical protein ILUMI_08584 [Ignelater luminosus]|uniref:Integrase catalytic domain-containing protein n=1 Tax=Ignelater luminosus TaxID=2038154 RepID=A0A8K0D440_IGNLU|nr:hypothetical protein ILUMI_08584 [Ignelater luminosus]
MQRRAKNFSLLDNRDSSTEGSDHLLVVPKCLVVEIIYQQLSEPLFAHLETTKTCRSSIRKGEYRSSNPFLQKQIRKAMVAVDMDYATHWVKTKALPDGTARHVAKFVFEQIIARRGSPKHFLSDSKKAFQLELLTIMGVGTKYTTRYQTHCNGLTERYHRQFLSHNNFCMQYNSSGH